MQAVAIVLLALAALCAAEYSATDDVVILTASNFQQTIDANQHVLVEFYAPWCGHCKSLEPHYKQAATALKADGIVLGALDATVHGDVASKFGVQGYPTLKFFVNGKDQEYNGGRTADTIVSWLRKRTGPAAKVLSAAQIADFSASNNVVVVGFFASENDADFKAFEAFAKSNDEFAFGASFDAEAGQANGLASGQGLVLFKKFDEGKNVLDDEDVSADEIAAFVNANSIPLVIPFTMEVAGKIFQSPIGAIALLFTDDAAPEFSPIAEKNRGKFVFTTSDSSFDRLNGYIGITKADFPKFYILSTKDGLLKYPLEGTPSAEAIEAHIAGFLDGSLKPTFKSDPIPENNDEPVTVIVGKNFESIVLDEKKDVLLEIYAPWCGHCKSLAPVWEQLGLAYDDNENIVIAKMDGTTNEVDGINIRGFPTLQWYPAGKKTAASAISYDGGRTLEDLKKYIDANAKSASAASDAKDEL